ncbi:MAG: S8 family serine peptidase [Nocardiopsaceae bacterium]|nr:S8 family serine peptidase [Nocardiopsaceae bacterium]
MSGSRRSRLFLLGAAAVTLGAGLALPPTAAASVTGRTSGTAGASSGPLAPAVDGAAAGGNVIVVLKDQYSGVNLRTRAAARKADARRAQAPVARDITAHGGTGLTRLVAPDAIAATVPGAEVSRLRADPAVAEIIPDPRLRAFGPSPSPAPAATTVAKGSQRASCPFNPAGTSKPLLEPEAYSDVKADPSFTGRGVIVANDGMNELAGNPNFTRPDGSHVVIDAPDYTANHSNDEDYGDASSIAAQGTVAYQYKGALPYSGVPAGCGFVIKGDAPGASLVDLSGIDTPVLRLSQVVAGIDTTVDKVHADVISESFGTSALPDSGGEFLAKADEAAVAAGVTVVESSGDSGSSGTMIEAADDPAVIAAGAVDNFRLVAMAHDYSSYASNNIAALSSGGTAPTGKVVDLVAPGYFGGEAACADGSGGCPPHYPTESMRGTSESAPLIAGAAADVIQAYRASHAGASPSPALVKQILTGTATDLGAPAAEQGAGLLDITAAVRAAQRMPGTTRPGAGRPGTGTSALVPSPSQLDVTSSGDPFGRSNVSLYNTGTAATTVTSEARSLGPERRLGPVVTERVSAPPAGTAIPPEGATAAPAIPFTVPRGLDELDADMIWPDPTNSNVICFALFDPQGRLEQLSYDDGAASAHQVPDDQHADVANPEPGRWTARILWSGTDQDLALPPSVPGTYTGPVSFKVSGQDFVSTPASRPVTIPAHSSTTIPLAIAFPAAPGDHPESVQFAASDGARVSVPVARRTPIPPDGGRFTTPITSTVGRMLGQQSTYEITVPPGRSSLNATFRTADASPDNTYTFYLVDPSGKVAGKVTSAPSTVNGTRVAVASLHASDPAAGTWQIQVVLDLTVSGKEFTQAVHGDVTDP